MNDEELISEFGSIGPIKFLDSQCSSIVDEDGYAIKCRCGKDAVGSIFSENCLLNLCLDCMDLRSSHLHRNFKDNHDN